MHLFLFFLSHCIVSTKYYNIQKCPEFHTLTHFGCAAESCVHNLKQTSTVIPTAAFQHGNLRFFNFHWLQSVRGRCHGSSVSVTASSRQHTHTQLSPAALRLWSLAPVAFPLKTVTKVELCALPTTTAGQIFWCRVRLVVAPLQKEVRGRGKLSPHIFVLRSRLIE